MSKEKREREGKREKEEKKEIEARSAPAPKVDDGWIFDNSTLLSPNTKDGEEQINYPEQSTLYIQAGIIFLNYTKSMDIVEENNLVHFISKDAIPVGNIEKLSIYKDKPGITIYPKRALGAFEKGIEATNNYIRVKAHYLYNKIKGKQNDTRDLDGGFTYSPYSLFVLVKGEFENSYAIQLVHNFLSAGEYIVADRDEQAVKFYSTLNEVENIVLKTNSGTFSIYVNKDEGVILLRDASYFEDSTVPTYKDVAVIIYKSIHRATYAMILEILSNIAFSEWKKEKRKLK